MKKKPKPKEIVNVKKTLLMARLRITRRAKDLTQNEVAAHLGLKRSGYNAYELGAAIPPTQTLAKLAELFGVSMAYLLGETATPTPAPAILREPLRHVLHERIDALCDHATTARQAALLAALEEWEKTL